ncbi:MAG TPA: hypothetical protein VLY23_09750 [Candidatus Acidoferrum sp.]|nr:hypothetical protein [Candidatus Acidoferrum sp.]
MARTKSTRRARAGSRRTARPPDFAQVVKAAAPHEPKMIQGVKLKTVSAFTLALALLCLAAFIAGEAPAAQRLSPRLHASKQSSIATHADGMARYATTER